MLNVGLVGFGFAGKTFHAPVIRVVQGLRLTTIVQRHGGGAPDTRYAAVEFVRSVDELLSRAVDLVVIATPNTSQDRKSTRLNSSHGYISYAVFCLKKKKTRVSATFD